MLFYTCRPLGAAFARLTFCTGLFAAALPSAAQAAGYHRAPARQPDVVAEFRALAQQRPWHCKAAQARQVPATGWSAARPECAWQDRLQMRTWSGPGQLEGDSCLGAPARWWAWARSQDAAPAAQAAAWRSDWKTQSLRDDSGPEKRIVVLRMLADGQWSATEWRWRPSPRAATRAWQQGRWDALAARAEQLRQPDGAGGATREARMLRQVLEANLGARPAELSGDILRWQSDGLCLQVDPAAPGPQQPQLKLPYSADDSRQEQRSAMQLQLARRYPKASWLSPFSLVPAARNARGGAKFYAIWVDAGVLKGQLWMPTRGDGPPVRVRITAALAAPAASSASPEALARPRQVLERELISLASRWAVAYE